MSKGRVFVEFWQFRARRRRYWLVPIVLVFVLFGLLIVFSQSSAVAPFIYTFVLATLVPTRILGVSAYYHDSAACLVEDGRIVAAAQEERFTRKKHDAGFPSRAVDYCLREAGITTRDIALVGFYEKPLVKFSRLLETYVACAPRGWKSYLMAMPLWLSDKLWMSDDIRGHLDGYEGEVLFGEHHESHAASAFYPSPFEQAAIVTLDGVGEWATSSIGVGRGHEIEMLRELRFPHSLGLLYSAFTYFTGFRVNSGEYKVMGLAPYGEPKYVKAIKDHLLDIRDDGSLWMNMEYFTYPHGLTMTGRRFETLFDGPARQPESKLTQREMDLARSVQEITEEVMLKMTAFARRETGMRDLCLAGGVALNCVGNGRILREQTFDQIWIQPAAGDAGGAVGAALSLWHRYLDKPRLSAEGLGRLGAPVGHARPRRAPALRRRHAGLVFSVHGRRKRTSKRSFHANGYPAQRVGPACIGRPDRGLAGRGKEVIGLFPGANGVRSARARLPLDHRRRALAADAVGDERQDQVPRIVPYPSPPRCCASAWPSGFELDGDSPYMCWSPTCCRRAACRSTKRRRRCGASTS